MKKIITLLIVFALACALLVGCNDNAETKSSYESVEEQSAESVVSKSLFFAYFLVFGILI